MLVHTESQWDGQGSEHCQEPGQGKKCTSEKGREPGEMAQWLALAALLQDQV